jgi:hypothetical protein
MLFKDDGWLDREFKYTIRAVFASLFINIGMMIIPLIIIIYITYDNIKY